MRRARDDHHSHTPSMPPSIRRKVFSIAVVLIVLAAGALSWIAISSHELLNQTADMVTRAGQVNAAVSALLENMIDAETGQRGYLLTRRKEYLEPYSRAVAFGPMHLHELQEAVADDSLQWARRAEIARLQSAKFALLASTIALVDRGMPDSAIRVVQTGIGKQLMDSARVLLASIRIAENQRLVIRQAMLVSVLDRAYFATMALCVLVIVFGITAGALQRRSDRLGRLVTVCAWSRTIQFQGEWLTLEEYLARRFKVNVTHGISPQQLDVLMKDELLHPEAAPSTM